MLGRFFNSFYYGKAGKGDYTPENLPKNRVELFFEVFRVRWGGLVRLNLLYILFLLPAILWSFMNYALLGDTLDQQASDQVLGLVSMWLLILWPCVAITGPATAGVSYIARNWARDQHSFFWTDFKDAFKANWKYGLVVSTISGFLPLLAFICYRFYGELAATSSVLYVVPQMLVIILTALWFLSQQALYTLMVTYTLKLGDLLRNSLILSVGKLPLSVGIRLLTLVFPGIAVLLMLLVPETMGYVMLVLVLYYLLFGFGFNKLLYASYANSLCEKYINPRIDGAGIGIGLRQVTDDDYEIDPTMPQPKPPDAEE